MIVHERFVFLHLHKSGGTFVNKALLDFVPGTRQIGYHLPGSELPKEFSGLEILGVVRNPWDYYVSWYSFMRQMRRPTFVFEVFSQEGRLGFPDTLERMLVAGEDASILDRLLALAPDAFTDWKVEATRGPNLTRRCLERLRGRRIGWYGFLFERMYGDAPVTFVRAEDLRRGLYSFLSERVPVSPELEHYLFHSPRLNTSEHEHYGNYYSERLARLVGVRDALVVERFGYTFAGAEERRGGEIP